MYASFNEQQPIGNLLKLVLSRTSELAATGGGGPLVAATLVCRHSPLPVDAGHDVQGPEGRQKRWPKLSSSALAGAGNVGCCCPPEKRAA